MRWRSITHRLLTDHASLTAIRRPDAAATSCRVAGLLRQLANNDGNKAAIAAAGGMELLNRAAAAHPSNAAVLEQACPCVGPTAEAVTSCFCKVAHKLSCVPCRSVPCSVMWPKSLSERGFRLAAAHPQNCSALARLHSRPQPSEACLIGSAQPMTICTAGSRLAGGSDAAESRERRTRRRGGLRGCRDRGELNPGPKHDHELRLNLASQQDEPRKCSYTDTIPNPTLFPSTVLRRENFLLR